jgi:hypothetical protein
VSADHASVELDAFARALWAGPHKQIVLVLGRAGWHASGDVRVPEHVHLLFLPARSPELQPCEHLWQSSDAPLVNRNFRDVDELEDVQLARCALLRQRRALIRSAMLFPGGPNTSENYKDKSGDVITQRFRQSSNSSGAVAVMTMMWPTSHRTNTALPSSRIVQSDII